MGNEADSIHQQTTSPPLARSKTFASNYGILQEDTIDELEEGLFFSGTKKSFPKYIAGPQKRVFSRTCISDTEIDDSEKVRKSSSSKDSNISKLIESSLDDSSSLIVIDRKAENFKLIAPAQSFKHNYHKKMGYSRVARRERRVNRAVSLDRPTKIDCSEYSSLNNRDQTTSESSIVSIWLNTKDEHGGADLHEPIKSVGRFSFAGSVNYPKLEIRDGRRMSTGTTLSELSPQGRPIDISFSRSSGYRASDSITISWPHRVRNEEPAEHRNCLGCGTYTGRERRLSQPECKQLEQRVALKSTFLSGQASLRVGPVKKPVSPRTTQKDTEVVKASLQVASSPKVIRAD